MAKIFCQQYALGNITPTFWATFWAATWANLSSHVGGESGVGEKQNFWNESRWKEKKKRFLVEAEKTGKLQVVLKIETAKLEQKKKIVVRVLILTTHKQLLFDLLQIKL